MKYIYVGTSCPVCKRDDGLQVPEDGLKAWQGGELIQNAFPLLSAVAREQLKTGICPKCWDEMFPPDADDDIASGGYNQLVGYSQQLPATHEAQIERFRKLLGGEVV